MDEREKKALQKRIDRLINHGKMDGKNIIIFGAAMASNEIKNCLKNRQLRQNAIVDNDPRKIGRECMGMVVQKPESLLIPFNNNNIILILSGGYYREIIYQLGKMGYQANKHIISLSVKTKETLTAFFFQLIFLLYGLLIYKRLSKKNPKGCTVFIAPYTGTGDLYLIGLFFFEYLRRHHISQYVFVVVSGACRKVAKMFGIQNVEVMTKTKVDNMINCQRALHMDWPVVILNDCWAAEYTNPLQWIRGYKGLSFDKMFRYFVFDLEDDTPYQLPPLLNSKAEVDRLFEEYGLTAGKTVVLSPFSNTLFETPVDFWTNIVRHCRKKGYTVCTNSSGKNEPPIEGTLPVFFPLNHAVEFVNKAGYFIGIRSGLCDIISSSFCRKIILYEKDGFFYKCSPLGYFSLNKMGLCDDAIEMEYRSDISNEVLEQIYNLI